MTLETGIRGEQSVLVTAAPRWWLWLKRPAG